MPIDERYFVWCREKNVNKGDRVEWDAHNGFNSIPAGSGVVELIWFGIEESLKVRTDDGQLVHLYPAEGIHTVRRLGTTEDAE